MNIIENLSCSSGLKASKPHIHKSFFPIIPEKYITIHTENHQSKQWDHLQEFLDVIKPILNKENIKIIEVGWNKVKLTNIDYAVKDIDPRQVAYIISKSILHIGVENFLTQLASFYNTPCISLYSNTPSKIFHPLWGENLDYKKWCIEPLGDSHRPSFTSEETPKSINSISCERVASMCLDILKINHSFNSIDVLYTGDSYHTKCVEIVPNFIPEPNFYAGSVLNVRMDYFFDESTLVKLASNRKLSIITDKPLNIGILRSIINNIEVIFVKINDSFDKEYIAALRAIGKPVGFILDKGIDNQATRFKFFDIKITEDIKKNKKDLDNDQKICDTTRYKSSKIIFSKNKQYSSKAAWEQDIVSHEEQIIIDCDSFWEESEYIKLYNIYDK